MGFSSNLEFVFISQFLSTLQTSSPLSDEVGDVAIDDLLHLLLDLLGQDTTTELLEESTVLRLEELSARLKLA